MFCSLHRRELERRKTQRLDSSEGKGNYLLCFWSSPIHMGQDCSRMAVRLILFAFFSWPLGWKWLLTTPAASGTWQYVGRQQQYLVTQSSSRRPTHSLLPFTQAEWKHQHSQTMMLAKNSNAYSTEQIWLKTVYDLIMCVGRAAAPAPLMICANGRSWDPVWRPHHLHLEGFYLAREEWSQEMLT